MKRFAISATLLLLLAVPARADIVPPPPPPPPPSLSGTFGTVVAGVAVAIGLALTGVWFAHSWRRTQLQG